MRGAGKREGVRVERGRWKWRGETGADRVIGME